MGVYISVVSNDLDRIDRANYATRKVMEGSCLDIEVNDTGGDSSGLLSLVYDFGGKLVDVMREPDNQDKLFVDFYTPSLELSRRSHSLGLGCNLENLRYTNEPSALVLGSFGSIPLKTLFKLYPLEARNSIIALMDKNDLTHIQNFLTEKLIRHRNTFDDVPSAVVIAIASTTSSCEGN